MITGRHRSRVSADRSPRLLCSRTRSAGRTFVLWKRRCCFCSTCVWAVALKKGEVARHVSPPVFPIPAEHDRGPAFQRGASATCVPMDRGVLCCRQDTCSPPVRKPHPLIASAERAQGSHTPNCIGKLFTCYLNNRPVWRTAWRSHFIPCGTKGRCFAALMLYRTLGRVFITAIGNNDLLGFPRDSWNRFNKSS